MIFNRIKLVFVCVVALLAGCASATVLPGQTAGGIVFYQPEPYLLVSAAGGQLIYLPNYSKPSTIICHAGWGTAQASVSLTNGWMLSAYGIQVDSKIPETVSAITAPLEALASKFGEANVYNTYRLYHIVTDPKTGIASGIAGPVQFVGPPLASQPSR